MQEGLVLRLLNSRGQYHDLIELSHVLLQLFSPRPEGIGDAVPGSLFLRLSNNVGVENIHVPLKRHRKLILGSLLGFLVKTRGDARHCATL
jgi:hypothetical protein